MENEMLYSIGEAVYTELEAVEKLVYPQSETPDSFVIETVNGERYELTLKKIA